MAEKKNKGGRPLKFKSAAELDRKINEYFDSCIQEHWEPVKVDGEIKWIPVHDKDGNIMMIEKEPITLTGLAVFLDTDRKTLLNYESHEDFFPTIKRAKARIEQYTEKQLFDKSAKNVAGIIFNLKNNYGWKDKQDIDLVGKVVTFAGEDELEN